MGSNPIVSATTLEIPRTWHAHKRAPVTGAFNSRDLDYIAPIRYT